MGLFDSIFRMAAQKDAQAFEHQEAAINRGFQHDEAQLAYERALEADSTKYLRQVQDLKNAGINPMMAVSSGAGSVQSSPASGSAAHSPGVASFSMPSVMDLKQLEIQERLASAQERELIARADNLDADTRGKSLYNDFFEDTANIRKVLLGDAHERNAWERELGFRGVKVKERAQDLAEESAKHYNEMLDKQKELFEAEKISEVFKRQMYAANAREASMNATYKAAMLEVDKKYTQAATDKQRNEADLLAIEARLKNGIYDEEYIKALHAQGIAESDIQQTIAAYKRGDYSSASKSLQKMFKAMEKEGINGNWSVSSTYFGMSGNGAASASALPASR